MLRALLAVLLLLPSLALAGPNTLAVLYFDNSGNPELEPLKVGLAEMMIADLHGTEPITVVERTQLQAILDELELGHSGVADASTAAKIGKLLGAEWMIFGTYSEFLGNLQISARLVRVETSEILRAEVVTNNPRQFVEMEKQLAGMMKETLLAEAAAAPAPTAPATPSPKPTAPEPAPGRRGEGESGKAPTTPGPKTATADVVAEDADTLAAAISFSEGLIYMDNKDMERARDSFEKAVAQDPGLDAAKSQLASLDL